MVGGHLVGEHRKHIELVRWARMSQLPFRRRAGYIARHLEAARLVRVVLGNVRRGGSGR